MDSIVSVVIPTYNRGAAITPTVQAIFESALEPGCKGELIIVDDGSAEHSSCDVSSISPPTHWSMRVLRQQNAGPAAARNNGMSQATGTIAVFVDDDVILYQDTLRRHIQAHRELPHAVIFGRCPFDTPRNREEAAIVAFLDQQGGDSFAADTRPFIRTDVVASGQLSVERADFPAGLYDAHMVTPAAEELELSARLQQREYPVYVAPGIVAIHRQPLDLGFLCRQQFKHGLGYAEAAANTPYTLELRQVSDVVARCSAAQFRDEPPLRIAGKLAKGIASTKWVRRVIRHLATLGLRYGLAGRLSRLLLRAAVSAYFVSGFREGQLRFRLYGAS